MLHDLPNSRKKGKERVVLVLYTCLDVRFIKDFDFASMFPT